MLSVVVDATEAEVETVLGATMVIVPEGAGFTVATQTARGHMLYLPACVYQKARLNTAAASRIHQVGTIISKPAPPTSFKQLYKQQIVL